MRQLLAGAALLLVVGIAGFLYRNTMERSYTGDVIACTGEARVCPDGSSVARSGPTCAFPVCPPPNVTLATAGISFVAPEGYETAQPQGAELARYTKVSVGGAAHTIVVTRYPRGSDTGEEIMRAHAWSQPIGERAAEIDERFVQTAVGSHQMYEVTVERFEGLVHTQYYLIRTTDVIRFEIVEHEVAEWMSSAPARTFPEHQILWHLLETLQAEGV